MTATTKVPLGAVTYVHKWQADVNTGTYAAPVWIGLFGTNDFKFGVEPTTKDDGDFDSVGWGSEVVSSRKWKLETTFLRKVVAAAPTTYDPGQEFLRAASLLLGSGNRVDIRVYEMVSGGPKVEAYRGYASVQWVPSGGANDEIEKVVCTLNGSGELVAITHPDGGSVVPVLYSITPAVGPAAGGSMHIIRGAGFMLAGVDNVKATSGIKFGTTNATAWTTISDSMISVLAPANTAGAYVVYVENAVGKSITATVTVTTS